VLLLCSIIIIGINSIVCIGIGERAVACCVCERLIYWCADIDDVDGIVVVSIVVITVMILLMIVIQLLLIIIVIVVVLLLYCYYAIVR